MKKLFTFLLALMASSCLWASITYNLNDGDTGEAKYNDYGWNNKSDMFAAFMTDAGVKEFSTLEEYKTSETPLSSPGICAKLTDASPALKMAKWAWLKTYIEQAHTNQAAAGASSLPADGTGAAWRYAVGAFFVGIQHTGWPKSADFTELGKDAAYIPAWGQNYGNPTDPTEEVTLVNPHRVGYIFGGWYDNPECTGTPITTVNASTTGTLYAKWVLDGIVYELNGGVWNEYGWTCKADICYNLQVDYNAAYSKSLAWAKKENDVVYYNIGGTWKTEDEAKGQEASVANFLYPVTWTSTGDPNFLTMIETTMKEKYGWFKDFITANRAAQSLTGDMSTLGETFYRAEISAFFLCSPARTEWPKSSSYETTGNYEDFQPYWGQAFPNPEHPTEEVTLHAPFKEGCKFLGWYDNEACTGTPVTKVDQNYKGTLYAKWVLDGIVYELNGGIWNEYGWTSKKDMYDAFLADWKAYSGSTRGTKTYEEQLGVGKSSVGIPTTISDITPDGVEYRSLIIPFFTESNYQTKWGWLATYIDAIAAQQGKTQPTTSGITLTFSLGNFFGEDNSNTTNYIGAVDFTGAEAHIAAFQTTWGQSFPGIEHPTESTVLHIAYKQRHNFEGWYDNAECTGAAITTVDQTYAGTLYAKWSIAPITYNLNGGQYNEYGWESKKDMYEDLNVDWNAFANKTNTWPAYETVYGVGNSNNGVAGKTDATFSTFFTNASYKDKWGWMVTYLDAIATKQGKTLPSTDAIPLRWGVGNFLCDDNNGSTTWHKAVDCTGEDGQLYTAQAYCSFTLPNPMYPTKEVTLHNPTKEGYIFDGWYAAADFSGAAVTKVNANTKGTLYAKWKEDAYSRTVTNGNYGTICLPKGSKQTSGAIFYELACKDAQYVYLDQVTILEAGVPYIFKATSNTLKVVYNATEVTEAGDYNGLYGTFVKIQDAATSDPNNVLEGNYLLVSNTIKKCGVDCKVLENRAYIKLEEIPNSASAAPGRNRVSMKYEGENEATGLDNITEDSNIAPALQGTYDIMGRKLTEPSTTGFYIVNGKKVIIMK